MAQNATIAIVVVCAFVIWTALLVLGLKLVNKWAQRMYVLCMFFFAGLLARPRIPNTNRNPGPMRRLQRKQRLLLLRRRKETVRRFSNDWILRLN
ncbi:hypothetical protein B0J14DRAFT_239523 [Halenospora varia]|nr:hypothetical protein B0J14DRAFT_239523 [Halenospora varia]